MTARRHAVITGTGRAGTTFLVELLTNLGLDTGFGPDALVSGKHENARAGLEHDIRENDCPYIVKSPWFCDFAEAVLRREDVAIDHILIPMRDLEAAAESRRHVMQTHAEKLAFPQRLLHKLKPGLIPGGLVRTRSGRQGRQEEILLRQIYKLLLAASDSQIPVTFMRFPRIVKDSAYLYGKLRPILGGIGFAEFSAAFDRTVRPELVHSFTAQDI